MDGDQSAKTLDRGANLAINDQDFTSGIHESGNKMVSSHLPLVLYGFFISFPHPRWILITVQAPAGEKTTGTGEPAFSKDGAIGSAFKADGAIGGMAQKVGGPFDKQGAIGKNFNADGSIGGMVQKGLGENKEGV